jgi:hypothetical protein
MKVKHTLLLLLLFALLPTFANTNNTDGIDSDFLDFLAEMEEVTGEGFENWLETDTEDENSTTRKSDE